MSNTPLLVLPEISEGVVNQAPIHNTALRILEAVGFRVLSRATTTPAVGPAEGDSYIIPAGATGVWSGKTNQMAYWVGGAWGYYTPMVGMGGIWVNDEDLAVSFYDGAWSTTGDGILTAAGKTTPINADFVGLIDTADSNILKKLTWANIKATLKTYFDTLYATASQPFDVAAFFPGVPTASAKVMRIPVARAATFPDEFAGSYGKAGVAATASTAFDVQVNGSSVGTITFATAATTATFVTAGTTVVLAAGDVLAIIAPASPDATLADVGFVLAGTR